MNLDAMKALLRDVESGSWPGDTSPIWGEELHGYAWKARWHDDMNAALALHRAMLPGWHVVIESLLGGVWFAWTDEERGRAVADGIRAPTPARALLIATLRGVIAKMEAGDVAAD